MAAENNTLTPDEPRKSQTMESFENLIEQVANADVKLISVIRAADQSPALRLLSKIQGLPPTFLAALLGRFDRNTTKLAESDNQN